MLLTAHTCIGLNGVIWFPTVSPQKHTAEYLLEPLTNRGKEGSNGNNHSTVRLRARDIYECLLFAYTNRRVLYSHRPHILTPVTNNDDDEAICIQRLATNALRRRTRLVPHRANTPDMSNRRNDIHRRRKQRSHTIELLIVNDNDRYKKLKVLL